MNQEKIYDIEKRVAELKFLERDLIKEREIVRLKSLNKAEKSVVVEEAAEKFFLNSVKANRKELVINSFPAKFTGRDDEEFLSEVKVEIRFKPQKGNTEYNELALHIYLNDGFQDTEVQNLERSIMDRLLDIRKEIDVLKKTKKNLKQNI